MGFLLKKKINQTLRASYWNVMGLDSYLLSFENPSWNYLMSKPGISQCEIHGWLRMHWGLERHHFARVALLALQETSVAQRDIAGLSCFKAESWG